MLAYILSTLRLHPDGSVRYMDGTKAHSVTISGEWSEDGLTFSSVKAWPWPGEEK